MKNKVKKIPKLYVGLTIFVIITCTVTIGGYVGYQYMGDYIFKGLVDSAGKSTAEQLEKSDVFSSVDGENELFSDGSTVSEKYNSIDPKDKSEAIALLTSKFSSTEIAHYAKMAAEGKLSEALDDVKAKLKERCTKEEIKKLQGWYVKYR